MDRGRGTDLASGVNSTIISTSGWTERPPSRLQLQVQSPLWDQRTRSISCIKNAGTIALQMSDTHADTSEARAAPGAIDTLVRALFH